MKPTDIPTLWSKLRQDPQLLLVAGVIVLGSLCLAFGLASLLTSARQNSVEVLTQAKPELESESTETEPISKESQKVSQITVDVGGAVKSPGVYRLPTDSRVTDALQIAGGLSVEADHLLITREMNLAALVKDGQKIYLPFAGEQSTRPSAVASSSPDNTTSEPTDSSLINLNSATLAELDTLPGIGTTRAEAIIANRPYQTLEELTTKAKIPSSVVTEIAPQVSL